MRKFILTAAMVLASVSAQAGQSRGLSTVRLVNDPPAVTDVQPAASDSRRADNVINSTPATQAAETPRYSAPPADTTQPTEPTRNTADTPRYSARPAPVTATASTAQPPMGPSIRRGHSYQARVERPHHRSHWTAGRVIALLRHYGVYW